MGGDTETNCYDRDRLRVMHGWAVMLIRSNVMIQLLLGILKINSNQEPLSSGASAGEKLLETEKNEQKSAN